MKRIVLLVVLFAAPVAAPAQNAASPERASAWWGSVGLSRVADPFGLGSHLSLTRRSNNRSLRLSFDGAANIKSTVTLKAASLSLGGHIGNGPLDVNLFVGPSIVWGRNGFDEAGRPLEEEYMTGGANIDLGAMFRLGSRIRFGAAAWANINAEENAVGVGPRLQIRFR